MIELIHKKKGQDAICGSNSRHLVAFQRMVTCSECLSIIKNRFREKVPELIHKNVIKAKVKELEESRIEKTIFNAQEKMNIETGIFYKNLCLGFDVPSLGYNIMPTK